jgi:hypothetical protein
MGAGLHNVRWKRRASGTRDRNPRLEPLLGTTDLLPNARSIFHTIIRPEIRLQHSAG